MLIFNQAGLLVPDAKIESNLEELQSEFVINIPSDKRSTLFKKLMEYNSELKLECDLKGFTQWIDGSFVTRTQDPGDIDLVTFLEHNELARVGDKINKFKYPNSERNYLLDAYIIEVYPEEHKERFKTVSDISYWLDRFTKTRRNRKGNKLSKGFLEIHH
ncbi:DUF6932 family protein [Desertivirga xinjiangensis]|uniref:DUF6932 family protein n=1 Tax=Desertivirga xinjiangensis TaxID=539206 RepID=UPI00210868E0|nr:hypothetical protein [Pedobacter xinjiangensis]